MLTASLASRNVESVNTATTVLLAQGSSSTLENPSDLSSQSPDVFGASGVAHSTDLVSQVPSSTTLYVSCFSCLYSVIGVFHPMLYVS